LSEDHEVDHHRAARDMDLGSTLLCMSGTVDRGATKLMVESCLRLTRNLPEPRCRCVNHYQ
jgi:hypothetical protein